VVNEIFESWSLPWHQLQRQLAEPFGAAATAASLAFDSKYLTSKSSRTAAPGAASSWLARARGAVPPARPTVR
jgi:hypothetical protein